MLYKVVDSGGIAFAAESVSGLYAAAISSKDLPAVIVLKNLSTGTRSLAENLGQLSAGSPPHQIHMKKPVLGYTVTQRKIGIRIGLGIDVGHAVRVADDFDRLGYSRYRNLSHCNPEAWI